MFFLLLTLSVFFFFFFFFNDTATTEIYTLSLHDALPISAGQPGERSADAERRRVDAGRAHAERGGHVGVLHRAPRDEAQPRPPKRNEDDAKDRRGDADEDEAIDADGVPPDADASERSADARHRVAEDRGDDADEEEAQAPRGEQRVDHPAIEDANDQSLGDDADDG